MPKSASIADRNVDVANLGGQYQRPASNRSGPPEGVVASYHLAPLQQGMLFNWLRDPRGGVDLEQITCTLEGIDVQAFAQAWQHLLSRHAPLRTVFRWQDVDIPVQDVLAEAPLDIHQDDLRALSPDQQRRHLDDYLSSDRKRGFDFAVPPLLRLAFFRTSDERHEFVWTFPHILLDGRSFILLIREVIEAYRAHEEAREPAVASARPYRDFIDWLEGQDSAAPLEYWTHALKGFSAPVFPDLGPFVSDPSGGEYGEQGLRLSRSDTTALRAFAKRHDITLNTMVQGAWGLLLSRYTASDDVVFGATRACRRTALDGDAAVSEMVGLFINTLPVRVRISPDESVIAWLTRIREDQIAVRAAEHTPLTDVQAASDLPAGASLFDTMIVFENQQQAVSFDAIDPRFHSFRLREKTTFPITLHGYGEAELLLRFEYYRDRFDDAAITRMLEHLAILLREMMAKPEGTVAELDMLSADEQRQLDEWNATADATTSRATTLTELLAECASQNPEAIALELGDESMTYRELDARAAQLARVLAARGVRAGVLVGICMERSFEMMVGLIGIMKAGGAYVPLDPEYPAERLAFMVSDAQSPVLLTQQRIAETQLASLPLDLATDDEAIVAEVLCLDRDWDRIVAESEVAQPVVPPMPDDLAYMIYTSGSTGRPKGAMNRHRGIVNFLLWMRREYALTRSDAVIQKTPISFDLSVPELFVPLMSGARLVLAEPGSHRDPAYLAKVMREHAVTVLFIVPSMLRVFLDGEGVTMPTTLRNVSTSGEALPYDLVERFYAQWPDAQLYNLYGPTEAAVEATYWICKSGDPRRIVPVGRPVANTRIHVLDATMKPVPIGVPGELFIGGVQVGVGYHRRPDLTAERFVADPFSRDTSARLYRTGDRARRLGDGTIEYLGRLDFQIKLRGFRIEVGEIEAALTGDDRVRECAVVLRTDPGIEPRLVAYYVPASEATASSAELRGRLELILPSYMVPWVYVPLDALPLSPSGKLDRKALPAPEGALAREEAVAPRDDTEAHVLRIWQEVLGRSNFGVKDRFNEIGGHSLAAVRLFSRIEKEFARKLQLVTILKHDTVEQLANLLRDPVAQDTWSCIVPFPSTATGIPIFCPHAQTGNVLIYQHFAKEVAEHHPVYGIQAYGNWGTQDPHESMEEMVDYYVAEILKVRPHGPYIFLGGSLGGYIALELAREMMNRGHEVRMVAMYDTVGPGYPRYTLSGRINKFVREHGGIPLWRLRRIFSADPKHGRSLRTIYWGLRSTARWWYTNTRRDYLYWKYEHHNPAYDFPMPANLTRVRLASRRMVARYTVRFFPGKITYFRARIQPEGSIHEPTNGWKGLSTELEIHGMPAGHTGGFSYPVVVELAAKILACLKADAKSNE
ncbi:MAG: amino acid adenylation domain-containing protein [bacterium]